jgi:hypothetical protein
MKLLVEVENSGLVLMLINNKFQEDCKRLVCHLWEVHVEETTKIVTTHGDELWRKDGKLSRLNKRISKLG